MPEINQLCCGQRELEEQLQGFISDPDKPKVNRWLCAEYISQNAWNIICMCYYYTRECHRKKKKTHLKSHTNNCQSLNRNWKWDCIIQYCVAVELLLIRCSFEKRPWKKQYFAIALGLQSPHQHTSTKVMSKFTGEQFMQQQECFVVELLVIRLRGNLVRNCEINVEYSSV